MCNRPILNEIINTDTAQIQCVTTKWYPQTVARLSNVEGKTRESIKFRKQEGNGTRKQRKRNTKEMINPKRERGDKCETSLKARRKNTIDR